MLDLIKRKFKWLGRSEDGEVIKGVAVTRDLRYDEVKVLDFYPLIKDYSYALVYIDKSNQRVYDVIEPTLSDEERNLLSIIKQRIFENISSK
jgi:hypothetical protein